MDKGRHTNSSTLFLVRLWADETNDEADAWRGRVVHLLSGTAHDFRDWQTLSQLLLEMMAAPETKPIQTGAER